MAPTSKINANGVKIGVISDFSGDDTYISLTDIAKYRDENNAFIIIANWM